MSITATINDNTVTASFSGGVNVDVDTLALATSAGAGMVGTTNSRTVQTVISTLDGNVLKDPPALGRGVAIGAPTGTPTAATSGAGSLTGTYRYAYAETDGSGISPLSPHAEVVASNNQVLVTVPQPRRGTSQRLLYRTKVGDTATFYLLKTFDGGSNYFQSEWIDNVADGSLGAVHPGTDTTALWTLELNNSVKFFRTHPDQGAGPADITVLTGDSGYTAGAYAMDVYGEILTRTKKGISYGSEKAGEEGHHVLFSYLGPRVDSDTPQAVWQVTPRGSLAISRQGAMSDPSAEDGNGTVLDVSATMGSSNTANAFGGEFVITGAGSAAFNQTSFAASMLAGYTGSAKSRGLLGQNASANSGEAIGAEARATGSAGISVGMKGIVTAGTKRFAVFGALDDIAPSSLTLPGGVNFSAIAITNGTTVGDIIQGFDDTALVFRVANGGNITATNVGAEFLFDMSATSGGGNLRLRVDGGNAVEVGSTNNVPMNMKANGATCFTATTRQTLNLPDLGGDPASPQNGDIWRNGANLRARLGGATVTIQVA